MGLNPSKRSRLCCRFFLDRSSQTVWRDRSGQTFMTQTESPLYCPRDAINSSPSKRSNHDANTGPLSQKRGPAMWTYPTSEFSDGKVCSDVTELIKLFKGQAGGQLHAGLRRHRTSWATRLLHGGSSLDDQQTPHVKQPRMPSRSGINSG